MSDKKTAFKFTLQFNNKDPAHIHVAELLNEQGRQKARYIVEAILFYVHNYDPSKEPPRLGVKDVEKIVRRVLSNQRHQPTQKGDVIAGQSKKKHEELDIQPSQDLDGLAPGDITAIANAINMFKKK